MIVCLTIVTDPGRQIGRRRLSMVVLPRLSGGLNVTPSMIRFYGVNRDLKRLRFSVGRRFIGPGTGFNGVA